MSSKSCPRFFHPLAAVETRSIIEFTADALVEEEGLEAGAMEDDADDQISMTPG